MSNPLLVNRSYTWIFIVFLISCSNNELKKECNSSYENLNERDNVICKIIEYAYDSLYKRNPQIILGKPYYFLHDSFLNNRIKKVMSNRCTFISKESFCSSVYHPQDSLHLAHYFFIGYLDKIDSFTYESKLVCAYAGYPTVEGKNDKCFSCYRITEGLRIKLHGCELEVKSTGRFFD